MQQNNTSVTTDWIVVGRFGRVHGVKGLITVHSFTEPRENILQYSSWHGFINKQWQLIKVVHAEITNKAIIASIEGYTTREQVALLTNVEIAVDKALLPAPAPGEYYCYELQGMDVSNQDGIYFGKVGDIIPTGSNDVLIIEGEKRHLVPYIIGVYVLDINRQARTIKVNWEADF